MFPEVARDIPLCLIPSGLLGEVDDRGMLANSRGIQEPRYSIPGWLSTGDNLISICHHPGSDIVANQVFCTKGKSIVEIETGK